MNTKLFASGLFAGLVAGLIAVLLQGLLMENLILEAEEYEQGLKTHFAGITADGSDAHDHASHDHGDAATASGDATSGDAAHQAENGNFSRFTLAFASDFVVFVAWGLILAAGFALAERFGKPITLSAAFMWGVAGFAAVHVLPGIGLAPELPGTPAAELALRQSWWVGTVLASIAGLALIGYSGGNPVMIALGAAVLVIPHLIGAPVLDEFAGVAPPELSGEYVARSYAVGFAAWTALGLAAGYFWTRQPDVA